jgi:hypothetical protein
MFRFPVRPAKPERTIAFSKADRKVWSRALTQCSLLDYSRALQLSRVQVKLLTRRALRQGAQNEPKNLFHRAEAAKRLQGCDRLRSRCMAVDSDCDPSFRVFRNSELGGAAQFVAEHPVITV